MIDYRKIERIATELEQRLCCGGPEATGKGTTAEMYETNAPAPSIAASDNSAMTASERIDGMRRLIKMARSVKASTRLTASEKRSALDRIRTVSESYL